MNGNKLIYVYKVQIHEKSACQKISQKNLCRMVRKRNLTMGKGANFSCLSKYIHPSLWVRNHHVNISKDHPLEKMTFRQRELKEIRGKDAMAIMVTAPRTVDDVDMTELYALENHF